MNLADILDAIYEADTALYRQWQALPDNVRWHMWIAKPDKPTRRVVSQQTWDMRGMVTGSRRKWKRGA